jgi:hypothetical protein
VFQKQPSDAGPYGAASDQRDVEWFIHSRYYRFNSLAIASFKIASVSGPASATVGS